MVDMKKIALFAAGTLFGSAGFKLLSSKDAKKLYTWQDWPARYTLWYASRSFVLLKSCRNVY